MISAQYMNYLRSRLGLYDEGLQPGDLIGGSFEDFLDALVTKVLKLEANISHLIVEVKSD